MPTLIYYPNASVNYSQLSSFRRGMHIYIFLLERSSKRPWCPKNLGKSFAWNPKLSEKRTSSIYTYETNQMKRTFMGSLTTSCICFTDLQKQSTQAEHRIRRNSFQGHMLFRGFTKELNLEAEQKEASNIEFHWSDSFLSSSIIYCIYVPCTVPTAV